MLDEVLGTVDVFELRPRIGLTSAALAERIPRDERVRDVVVSASYGVVGRWREEYDDLDHARARAAARARSAPAPARPHLRHPQRGRAQAGPDRARADDRPRAAAARRAGGGPRPRRPRGPASRPCRCSPSTRRRRPPCWCPTTSRRSRPGSPTRCCCAQGRVVAAGPVDEVLTEAQPRRRPSGCRWCSAARTAGSRRAAAPAGPRADSAHLALRMRCMEWLRSTAWARGSALAVLLGVAEMFSLDLILVMLAVGAVAGLVTAARGRRGRPVSSWSRSSPRSAMLALVRPEPGRTGSTPAPTCGSATASWSGSRAWSPRRSPPSSPAGSSSAGEIWTAQPYDENTHHHDRGRRSRCSRSAGRRRTSTPIPRLEP